MENEKLTPAFMEPMRQNRFYVKFPEEYGIPDWVGRSTERPKMFLDKEKINWLPLKTSLWDVIGVKASKVLMEIINTDKADKKLTYNIVNLDPTGVQVESWEIVGKIVELDLGLNLTDGDGMLTINFTTLPETVVYQG